jgi:elongation factor 2
MERMRIEKINELISRPDNIRNVAAIASVGHGKSTLTDHLIAKAGIIPYRLGRNRRSCIRYPEDSTDSDNENDQEESRNILKSTGVSFSFGYQGSDFLLNFIDSPRHVDCSSDVTTALRVTDGALFIVDCVEGVRMETETVLRQAMQEKIRPVLMINKVDRAILDLKLDPDSIYLSFSRIIEKINAVVNCSSQADMGKVELDPSKGNVCFGSGKDGWGFTLKKFADIYGEKFGIDPDKLMRKFWGDNFYDPKNKVWRTEDRDKDGSSLKRAFVMFIIEPIVKIYRACIEKDQELIDKLLVSIGVKLYVDEKEFQTKKLFKIIMHKWIYAAEAILEMMILHLPSPKVAQAYRYKHLYE